MELYFFTRGIKDRVDQTLNDLQAQTFPRKYKGKILQSWGSLRPIQFWAYAFPEPELQTVLKMMGPAPSRPESLNKYGVILRKILHAKKIPPIDLSAPTKFIRKQYVQIWGIGIREDKFNAEGEEQL